MDDATSPILLYGTAPDETVAKAIAKQLLEARLCACVNTFPAGSSLYYWNGGIEEAEEVVFIVKTTKKNAAQARDLIAAAHPYETPCVLAIPLDEPLCDAAFLKWIYSSTIS